MTSTMVSWKAVWTKYNVCRLWSTVTPTHLASSHDKAASSSSASEPGPPLPHGISTNPHKATRVHVGSWGANFDLVSSIGFGDWITCLAPGMYPHARSLVASLVHIIFRPTDVGRPGYFLTRVQVRCTRVNKKLEQGAIIIIREVLQPISSVVPFSCLL